uniref:SIN3-HDAC complex associated factor n=1 Tax=Eptatretus burgeri TaxID=7764 RepID=A0A8C4RBH7_EPTBU
MFGFHRPKVYRSTQGCCICKAKSSSSRFTDSRRYEAEFESCFGLVESRSGEICNACVLLVKRWKKLPAGSDRTWNHVVDARAGPGIKTTLKPKKLKSNFSPRNIGICRVKETLKKQRSDARSTASSTSPSCSPSYSTHSDDGSDTEVGGSTREPSISFLDPTYWKRFVLLAHTIITLVSPGQVVIDSPEHLFILFQIEAAGRMTYLEVSTLASKPSSLGLNPNLAIICYPAFQKQGDSSMCVPSLGWTLNWTSRLLALIGRLDPAVYFMSWRAIAGILDKFLPCWEGSDNRPSITLAKKPLRQHRRSKGAWQSSEIVFQMKSNLFLVHKCSALPVTLCEQKESVLRHRVQGSLWGGGHQPSFIQAVLREYQADCDRRAKAQLGTTTTVAGFRAKVAMGGDAPPMPAVEEHPLTPSLILCILDSVQHR